MNTKYFKSALLAAAVLFTACEADPITVGKELDGNFDKIYETAVQVTDLTSGKATRVLEMWNETESTEMKVVLSRTAAVATEISFVVDPEYLAEYNQKNGTAYELYPADLVSFGNGSVSVGAGEKEATIEMTVSAMDDFDPAVTYVIPVGVKGRNVELYDEASHCFYMVNDMRSLPNCDKGEGAVKGFLFFEVNDTNPLNALSFQLENGKLVWDAVVLFAANINYDSQNQRAYISCNPNVQYLLDNNETLLQPLRKRGIKVILGLLGNHDIAGLAQLSDAGAKDFAAEVAYYCEAYNLDGVNYDDEYSKAPDLSNPYFTQSSYAAAARLSYETKKAMPDKLVTIFAYGQMYSSSAAEVYDEELDEYIDADYWVDVAVPNYGSSAYPIGDMTYEKCAGAAMEFALGYTTFNASYAQRVLDGGYGWIMGFAPSPANYSRQFNQLGGGCATLWGSRLKAPTVFYKKNDPKPYVWPDDLYN